MNYHALFPIITLMIGVSGIQALEYKESHLLSSVARLLVRLETLSAQRQSGLTPEAIKVDPIELGDLTSSLVYFSRYSDRKNPRMRSLKIALKKVFGQAFRTSMPIDENMAKYLAENKDLMESAIKDKYGVNHGSLVSTLIKYYSEVRNEMLKSESKSLESSGLSKRAAWSLLEALMCPNNTFALPLGRDLILDASKEIREMTIVLDEHMDIDKAHEAIEQFAAKRGNFLVVGLGFAIFSKIENIVDPSDGSDSHIGYHISKEETRKNFKFYLNGYKYDCKSLFSKGKVNMSDSPKA